MTTLLTILRTVARWLRDHPGAALAIVGAGLVAWWRQRAKRADGQRDAANARTAVEHRRADEAEAAATVAADVAEAREAGHVLAGEIRSDVQITDDAAADRARLYARVRDIARREGLAPAAVPDAPAAGAGRDDASRDRR